MPDGTISTYNPPITTTWRVNTDGCRKCEPDGHGVLDITIEKACLTGHGKIWLIRGVDWKWLDGTYLNEEGHQRPKEEPCLAPPSA